MEGSTSDPQQEREWRRQLEHERLSQLAMPASDSRFAGPGAAAAETEDEEGTEGAEETGGAEGQESAEGAEGAGAAAGLEAATKATPIITNRVNLWLSLGTIVAIPLTLLAICGHKLTNDRKLRSLAATIAAAYKSAGGKAGGATTPRFVQKIIQKLLDNAAKLLALEQWVLALLMVLVFGLIGALVVGLGTWYYCSTHLVECGMAGAKDLLIR